MSHKSERAKSKYSRLYDGLGNEGHSWPAKIHFVRRLLELGTSIMANRAIEFGCGMGQDAVALANLTGWSVSATDVSKEMLKNVPESLHVFLLDVTDPKAFPCASYDLSFSSFVTHLLDRSEKLVFYRRAHYTLSSNGLFVLLTASEEQLRSRRINHYFPSALSIDMERYLTINDNLSLLKDAGFSEVTTEPVSMGIMTGKSESSMFERRDCSIFCLLPDDEYNSGMKRMRENEAQSNKNRDKSWTRTLLIARK